MNPEQFQYLMDRTEGIQMCLIYLCALFTAKTIFGK